MITTAEKKVQTMSGVLEIAYQPKCCVSPCCPDYQVSLKSSEWLQIAPMYCTYSYDIIASTGWQRQKLSGTFAQIHAPLSSSGIIISESQVRHLYYERYLPLLACHERTFFDKLKQVADKSGLLLSLDGLAPEGGEAQLWVVRELHTCLTVRSGWLGAQDQKTFENFLQPIADMGLKVTGVMSDKQRGLVPAVQTVFPDAAYAFCHSHYLNNIAAPVSEVDESMKVTLRKNIRKKVGPLIRSESSEGEREAGVLTVTGLIPSPIEAETPGTQKSVKEEQDEIVDAFMRRTRYLLTLKGRPPFRLAGIEMVDRLTELSGYLVELINHNPDERLVELQRGLCSALETVADEYADLSQAAAWLRKISELLDPDGKDPRTGDQVRTELFDYLAVIKEQSCGNPVLSQFAEAIAKTTGNYEIGLFYSYDIPGLPRTNNDRESEFRNFKKRILITTGQKGATRRLIQRSGAWELIPCPDSIAETTNVLSQTDIDTFAKERQRIRNHWKRV